MSKNFAAVNKIILNRRKRCAFSRSHIPSHHQIYISRNFLLVFGLFKLFRKSCEIYKPPSPFLLPCKMKVFQLVFKHFAKWNRRWRARPPEKFLCFTKIISFLNSQHCFTSNGNIYKAWNHPLKGNLGSGGKKGSNAFIIIARLGGFKF